MRVIAVLLIAMSLMSAPALVQAQDEQTAEGAHKFLHTVLTGMSAETKYYKSEDGKVFERANGNITLYEPDGDCKYTLVITSEKGGLITKHSTTSTFAFVVSAENKGSTVDVNLKFGDGFLFFTGSDALATRTAYAMNFLILHCDPAANTGF